MPEFMKAGYEILLKSIVLLKNSGNILPITKEETVFITQLFIHASRDFMGNERPERWEDPLNLEIVEKYYHVTDDPAKADFTLVLIQSPLSGGQQDMTGPRLKRVGMDLCLLAFNMDPIPRNFPGTAVSPVIRAKKTF